MKNDIINFVNNINIVLLSLIIISFILSHLFLYKRKISFFLYRVYLIVFVTIAWICFWFFNDRFNDIFKFNYLNIKTYLLLLIIVNIITIINVNFVKRLIFKIINYIMFFINIIIFIFNIFLFIGNRLNIINITIYDLAKLMNISYILFLIYLNIMGYLYLLLFVIDVVKSHIFIKKKKNVEVFNDVVEEDSCDQAEAIEDKIDNDSISSIDNELDGKDKFIIDGVDCSVIFDDLNKNEILENYYILLNDVNAKLVNGYTVHEYKRIKDIINRLNIKDMNKIKIDINKLSMITYDEYNLLKSYLKSKNIKI